MKVSDLSGALLDYWVARAEGYQFLDIPPDVDGKNACRVLVPPELKASGWVPAPRGRYGHLLKRWSSDWAEGGPIIERERGAFSVEFLSKDEPMMYIARMGSTVRRYQCFGPTHLIAAMRAYVGSKFGDEVPDAA